MSYHLKTFFSIPIFIFIFLLGPQNTSAIQRYEMTPALRNAYNLAMSLRIKESVAILNQSKKNDPDNLMVWFIEDYIDFLVIFISEDKAEFERLSKNEDIRLNKLSKGDPKSPYNLLSQAEVKLHWAILKTKFGNYLSAFNSVSKAYNLLEKNQQKFPNFIANKKSLGAMHALVGTIPDSYKWGVTLMSGLNGTIEQGMKEIEDVIKYSQKNPFEFEEEVLVEYAFLTLHLKNESEKAWNIINNSKLKPKENPLAAFALANMAMHTGRNDEAIKILQNAPNSSLYYPFLYLQLMLGSAKLSRMDTDADDYMLRFVNNFKGRFAIKEAYMKLAWHALINNDNKKYNEYLKLCKSKGTAVSGNDKNALKEANSNIIPDITLLKTRILFDGGYYQRALDLLKAKSPDSYQNKAFQLEYYYRLGRILHLLKNYNGALQNYQATIDNGKSESYYFACNAALQAGNICEDLKQFDKAKSYYNICLELAPDDYADALHAKAKAGLNRIKKYK